MRNITEVIEHSYVDRRPDVFTAPTSIP